MYSKPKSLGHSIFPSLVVVGLTIVPAFYFGFHYRLVLAFPFCFSRPLRLSLLVLGSRGRHFAAQHR